MPRTIVGAFAQYYRIDGRDDAPVLVLAHSLGLDQGMWDEQARALAPHFRIVRYDLRGHGATDTPSGDWSVADLGRDVLALMDALGIDRFAFCGLSIGGMVGQWLGIHAGARLTHLVLANTSPRTSDPSAMETRRRIASERGMAPIADLAMPRWFTPSRLAAAPVEVAWARRTLLACDPAGYAGCCAAVRDHDETAHLSAISTPTLVISGDEDVSMPWPDHGHVLAQAIAFAKVVRLAAAHFSNLEQPRSFNAALFGFLLPASDDDQLTSGERVRRSVLGDAHVDRAMAKTNDLTRDFQELLTRYAWSLVWARPEFDHRTRRILVLALLSSLGRWDEFRSHLNAALDHGFEWCDVKETLLQVSVYAGVPVANTAFHIADDVRAERARSAT
jgi:3-oxoadipate enol-lactonase/4-carboxymuconolactone decarboxylase